MLNENDLCNYYAIDETPGISKKDSIKRNFDFLEDPELIQKLIEFSDGKTTAITFDIPQMHCSSCVWILENLYKFDSGVIHSEVNFLKKTLSVKFRENETTIKNIVEQLDSLGYIQNLSLETNRGDK